MKKLTTVVILTIVFLSLTHFAEAQCAMCKAAVESSQGQKNSVAGGINQGIIYLMVIPYFLLAFIFRKQLVSLWKSFRGKPVEEE